MQTQNHPTSSKKTELNEKRHAVYRYIPKKNAYATASHLTQGCFSR
jgi:hypothetical protein